MSFINQIEPFIGPKEGEAAKRYLSSGGWLTEFKETEKFEKMISEFLNVKYTVLTTSGTVALYLSLLSSGLKKGDRVLVPNFTMIATINAVKWAGLEPVIVDIDPETLCANLKIESDIKALIYVPINGRSGDMNQVRDFCKINNLFFIEDAAQAFGSKWENQYLGTFSDIGVFSFTPHKIITTGQGGALVTNNLKIFKKLKKFKDFHRVKAGVDIHDGISLNFKFTDLQAVVGIEQMNSIEFRVERKKEIFKRYRDNLKDISFIKTDLSQTVPWFVDLLVPNRDNLINYLKTSGIGSRPFYPPIYDQMPYRGYKKEVFKISEDISSRGLWLPSSLNLKNEEIDFTCEKIIECLDASQKMGWPMGLEPTTT